MIDILCGKQRVLKYISMFIRNEISLFALLTLYHRFVLKLLLDDYSSLEDFGLDLPQDVLCDEYGLRLVPEAVDPVIFSGIFWVIDDDLQLLMFGIPCDERGNIVGTSAVQPNSRSGKTYNHKITWETVVATDPIHKPYNKHPYNYFPRGRVEIDNRCAVIFINPHINQPDIVDEIKLKFGLGNHKITKIRIVEDNSAHYQCLFDWEY